MIVMGVEHVIVFLNLSTYYEQDMVKSFLKKIITTMYIKDGKKNGKVWWLLREGIVDGSKKL